MPYQSVDEIVSQKKNIKKKLFEKLGIPSSKKSPLFSIIADGEMSSDEIKMLRTFNEGIKDLNADFIILADNSFDGFSNFQHIEYNIGNREMILEASDFVIAFGFNDLEELSMQGCVPVSMPKIAAENYDAQNESGNAFVYQKVNGFSLFEACVRAIETFNFPWDFKNIIRNAMKIGKNLV